MSSHQITGWLANRRALIQLQLLGRRMPQDDAGCRRHQDEPNTLVIREPNTLVIPVDRWNSWDIYKLQWGSWWSWPIGNLSTNSLKGIPNDLVIVQMPMLSALMVATKHDSRPWQNEHNQESTESFLPCGCNSTSVAWQSKVCGKDYIHGKDYIY